MKALFQSIRMNTLSKVTNFWGDEKLNTSTWHRYVKTSAAYLRGRPWRRESPLASSPSPPPSWCKLPSPASLRQSGQRNPSPATTRGDTHYSSDSLLPCGKISWFSGTTLPLGIIYTMSLITPVLIRHCPEIERVRLHSNLTGFTF